MMSSNRVEKFSFHHYWVGFLAILALIAVGLLAARNASAQVPHAYVYMLRAIELNELDVESIEGLAYSPRDDVLVVIESPTENGVRPVALITRIEELRGTTELQGQPSEVLNTAFNVQANKLFTFDPSTQELTATALEPEGRSSPAARFNLRMGIQQAGGMDFDPRSGKLFILDSAGKRLWVITPDEAENYSVGTGPNNNRVQRVNLKRIEKGGLQGLAFNPNSGNLFTFDQNHATLFEMTQHGELVSTRDVSSFKELRDPAGMVFAPSGDMTDDPSTNSLYVANSFARTIVELSITPVEVMALPTPIR